MAPAITKRRIAPRIELLTALLAELHEAGRTEDADALGWALEHIGGGQ